MQLEVNDRFALSPFVESDQDALVECLCDREIYERTLRIPFPYLPAHAAEWLALIGRLEENAGGQTHWAIRQRDGRLVGACGFEGLQIGTSHRAELGYWLARPYWGQGVMTAVVERICRYALSELGLVKINAHVFSTNAASARVLEKCGFQAEGVLKQHYRKDGKLIDAIAYARFA